MITKDQWLSTARDMEGAVLEFIVVDTGEVIEVREENGNWERSDGYGGRMGHVQVYEIRDDLEDEYGEVVLDYISYSY